VNIIANILVALAVLLTILLFVVKADLGRLSGPDRSGADIILYILMGGRWILMAIVLSWCVAAGRFDWIGGGPGTRWLAVIGTLAGLGFVSAISMIMSTTQVAGVRIGSAGMIGWAGLPGLVMIVTLAAIDGRVMAREGAARWLQFGLAGLALIGWLAFGTIWGVETVRSSRRRAEGEAQRAAEQARLEAEWSAKQAGEDEELERMDPALPLEQWIVQTHLQYSDKHQERAAELIAERPRLVEELSEMLGREDAMQREYANDFIRRLKPPPAALIPALAGAERKLAAQFRDGTSGKAPMPSHVSGMSKSSLMTAQAMGDPAELRSSLAEILAALEAMPEGDAPQEVIAMYRRFLSAEVGHGRAE